MEILRFQDTQFSNAYGIFCSSIAKQGARDGLYPTFGRIPLAGKTNRHSHFEPELFYIIHGQGTITIANEMRKIQSGDLIRVPPHSEHQLNNSGIEELVFLSVYCEDFEIPKLPIAAVITAAPPTPNGPLHLGHISGPYLASDIATRYLRLQSIKVLSYSGTDDHQNYVYEKAFNLQMAPTVFRDNMGTRIKTGFQTLHISFDKFVEPHTDENYQNKILSFVRRAIELGVIQQEIIALPYCNHCQHTLIDARIAGNCPICQEPSRGNCENCGIVVPPQDLLHAKCSRCDAKAGHMMVSVYTFSLSKYLPTIQKELAKLPLTPRLQNLQKRVSQMSNLSVLLTYPNNQHEGICLPESTQTVHVWFEMAAHYEQFALSQTAWLHCFGFDNSFHYLFFIPALLRAMNPNAKWPDAIICNEFLHLAGQKFSTSREHAIWADDFTGNSDHLRLYLSFNRPSTREADFLLADFESFSLQLQQKLQLLQQRARIVAKQPFTKNPSAKLIDCNRFTREMEYALSPQRFDLRRASRCLLTFMDLTLQAIDVEPDEKWMLQTLGTLMLPFMPMEAEILLNALAVKTRTWISDWTN